MRTVLLPVASVAALALSMGQPAHAATYEASFTAAGTCQLSIPSIDTKVRSKASGYRNEGSTNAFVICSPFSPTINGLENFRYFLVSMDGAGHSVTCTGTSGNTGEALGYSTKTLTAVGEYGTEFQWTASDFGGSLSEGSGHVAMTCALPPNVAINMGYMAYNLP